ncbi:MAG: NUDIX domain-containing protein [Candidatus Pacebacteria bacterium]|nr:NUDIX domain-containing protein [Candidatus Paceibacterota bacterium]
MERLLDRFKDLVKTNFGNEKIATEFLHRLNKGNITKDEDSESHFCVYFAAYDLKQKQLFIGHHKKSGLLLFNGGHIDKGEFSTEAVEREIEEEWGIKIQANSIDDPRLLTITEIDNPTKQTCRRHYDIWYFISVNKDEFFPSRENLSVEFYDIKWMTSAEAKRIVIEPGILKAIKFLEEKVFV